MKISRKNLLLIVIATLLGMSCSNDVVPVNARLVITPESRTINIIEQQDVDDRCL